MSGLPPGTGPERRRNRRVLRSQEAEAPSPDPLVPEPQTPDQAAAPHSESTEPAPRRVGRLRRLPWARMLLGLALAGALVASLVALPVRQVTVSGHSRLTEAQVRRLAGLGGAENSFGWLYYGAWRARGLLQNPWVQAAVVTRTFPDRVAIQVTERRPLALFTRLDGRTVMVAQDGTLLPRAGAPVNLPVIQGWGPERLSDALQVLRALGQYNVKSVLYSPSGLKVKLAAGSVWSGDVHALLKYAGSISMYPNKNINIYPWGVSVQE
ncbi:cell division protein FtsQ/DivIB [Deinococcus hohokamensis]|uniref:Cell division protein FtsQ/DivIB n=1 Tax=Deinococcus hohokamensis TaxID=309883 RepID=A0ABV9I4D1_9DEIO